MTLHPPSYLALTDHLHFAVERSRQQLMVTNRLAWEIQHYYPQEYAVGLPDEEAADVAFHAADARHGEASTTFDTLRAVKLIDAVVTIVRYRVNLQLMDQNLHVARFMSHMRYFATRFLEDRMSSAPTTSCSAGSAGATRTPSRPRRRSAPTSRPSTAGRSPTRRSPTSRCTSNGRPRPDRS